MIARLAQTLEFSNVARDFLKVLIDHERIADLPGILEAFDKIVDERRGILQVEVTSAQKLDERQRNDLGAAARDDDRKEDRSEHQS